VTDRDRTLILRCPIPYSMFAVVRMGVANCCQEHDRNHRPPLPEAVRCSILPKLNVLQRG
jgi:hypothetical protein